MDYGLFLFVQILAVLVMGAAFWMYCNERKNTIIPWALAIALFAVSAMMAHGLEEKQTLKTFENTTVTGNYSETSITYTTTTTPINADWLVWLNVGFFFLAVAFLFADTMNWAAS